jgi:hypothetical protein
VSARFPVVSVPRHSYRVQAVGGLDYAVNYGDNDAFHIVVEYFYNELSINTTRAYLGLLLPRADALQNSPDFFYLGRHYGAVALAFPKPFSWDLHSFTLTNLGNFSDRSFITRLDYSLVLHTHLSLEAYAAVRYGSKAGEFRLGIDPIAAGGETLERAPNLLDLGINLRLRI